MPEPDLPPAPPHESQLRIVFIGPQGVRSGWRLLMFLALVAVLTGAAFLLQKTIAHSFSQDFSATNVIVLCSPMSSYRPNRRSRLFGVKICKIIL